MADKKKRNFFENKWPEWLIFFSFFCYTLLVSLLIQLVLLPYVFPAWHAGEGLLVGLDSIDFHFEALDLANTIRAEGWQSWNLSHQPVARIAAIFYVLIAPHPWAVLPLNSLLHALAGFMMYKAMQFFLDKQYHSVLAALPILLFPSALSWVAQMHNDNYAVTGSVLIVYAWVCLSSKASWEYPRKIVGALLSVLLGLSIIWLVREYVVFMYTAIGGFLWIICLFIFIFRWWWAQWKWHRAISAISIVTAALFLVIPFHAFFLSGSGISVNHSFINSIKEIFSSDDSYITNYSRTGGSHAESFWEDSPWLPSWIDSQLEQLSLTRYKAIDSTWTETRGASNIDTDINFRNALEIFKYFPRAFEIGLLSPFPADWFKQGSKAPNTMMRRVAGFEMSFVYLSYLGMLGAIWCWRKKPELWIILLLGFGMVLIYTLGTPNVGTLYRLRFPFILVLVCLGTAGWIHGISEYVKMKEKTKKRK